MPGFTVEQIASLQVMITAVIYDAVNQAISQAMTAIDIRLDTRLVGLKARIGPDYQQQSIAEKPAEKPTEKPTEKIAEKSTEKTAEKQSIASSSDNDNTGTLSTIPHQATMHYCRESSPRLNGAPLSTLTSLLASQIASLPGYIHYAKCMEAIGQGQVHGYVNGVCSMQPIRDLAFGHGNFREESGEAGLWHLMYLWRLHVCSEDAVIFLLRWYLLRIPPLGVPIGLSALALRHCRDFFHCRPTQFIIITPHTYIIYAYDSTQNYSLINSSKIVYYIYFLFKF